jgi:hypothetical protein
VLEADVAEHERVAVDHAGCAGCACGSGAATHCGLIWNRTHQRAGLSDIRTVALEAESALALDSLRPITATGSARCADRT